MMVNCSNEVCQVSCKVVGYWFNEKKSQKFGANELAEACRKRSMDFVKIDLECDLENQGPFDLILHKLTALYAPALAGDVTAVEMILKIEKYVEKNRQIVIIDPLESVQRLLLRVDTYYFLSDIIKDEDKIFTPNFVTLMAENIEENSKLLEENGVSFPVVCKPLHAGGGKDAHQMAVVFNKNQLKDCCAPCVVQSFINHNAVLYKIFVIGARWFVTIRPSLKNFEAGDFETIFFNSHQISKPDSCSPLTMLDSKCAALPKADLLILQRIITIVKEPLQSELLGIDVVIDVSNGNYGIIDVNPFPSFDSVPDVMDHIADVMCIRLNNGSAAQKPAFYPSVDMEIDQKYYLQDVTSFGQGSNKVYAKEIDESKSIVTNILDFS